MTFRPSARFALLIAASIAATALLVGCGEDDLDFTSGTDVDGDGILGDGAPPDADNCPFDPNPAQLDSDGDSFGDVCDCTQTPRACEREGTHVGKCANGIDDDGDGLVDVADPNCRDERAVNGNCGNGVDDDGDARADCADLECSTAPGC